MSQKRIKPPSSRAHKRISLPRNRDLSHICADVLFHVMDHLDVEDMLKLLYTVGNLTPNISDAFARRIKRLHLNVTNRSRVPLCLEAYKRLSTYLNFDTMEYLLGPARLPSILSAGLPTSYITISFHIWGYADLQEFLTLCGLVPKRSGLKYNLELEFDSALVHLIDLSRVVELFADLFGANLAALNIGNFTGDFELDMESLPSLEVLWLVNTNVRFTTLFEKNKDLEILTLHSNFSGVARNVPITIKSSLPVNVGTLRLGHTILQISSPKVNMPRRIRDLTLVTVRDPTENLVLNMVEHTDVSRTLLIYESALAECSCYATYSRVRKLLKREVYLRNLALTNIFNEDGNWDFSATQLRELKLSKSNVRALRVSPEIEKLDLSKNNIVDIQSVVLMNEYRCLRSLNIAENPIDWDSCPDMVVFSDLLRDFELSYANIGKHLPRFIFPKVMDRLVLDVNEIISFENVHLPILRCTVLSARSNSISRLNGWWLPPKMKVLDLTENAIRGYVDLSRDIKGVETEIEILHLGNNSISSLLEVRLPPKVQILTLDHCPLVSLKDVTFPSLVKELNLQGCEILSILSVLFGPDLQLCSLNLAANNIDETNLAGIDLPPSLRQLNLSGNQIENLSANAFAHLANLEVLTLSGNKLQRLSLNVGQRLQALDLSFNQLDSLNLYLPTQLTPSLSMLNLSLNKFTRITPSMIGHGVHGAIHTNLLELDISANENLADLNLAAFPSSLAVLIEEVCGTQDKYGYDIGTNTLGESYCLGKRIDIPYF